MFSSGEPFQCSEVRLVSTINVDFLMNGTNKANFTLYNLCVGFKTKPVTPDRTETEHATPNRNVRIAMAKPTAVAPKVLESAVTVGRIHVQSEVPEFDNMPIFLYVRSRCGLWPDVI